MGNDFTFTKKQLTISVLNGKNPLPMQETQENCFRGLERSPGVGNGNSLQYSCLENSMDRGALWGTVHSVTKSWTLLSK